MAHRAKALATQQCKPSSTSRTHVKVEGENLFQRVVPQPPYVHHPSNKILKYYKR